MNSNEFDVIIIGSGTTGAGTARDCALRGLRVLLVERSDMATGASGRNHGLLHSGARYAIKDPESARECISENRILRSIATGCIEDTGGLFITLPEDEDAGYGLDYQKKFVEACEEAGIETRVLSPADALRDEPSVNPKLLGAVYVPDGSVDPFRLCNANVQDAILHGAVVLTYTTVTDFIVQGGEVRGVRTLNIRTGDSAEYYAPVTVNAAGIWGQGILEMAGIHLAMYPSKGSLLVFGHRVNNVVINRCRPSSDGDILVPGDTVSVIGTTSTRIPYSSCDSLEVTPDEVRLLLREGCALCPSLANTRILRAYAGVRPLLANQNDPTGRSISRGIVCIDHQERDGIKGLVTITGGKLMTYRLMAEKATDVVCSKLGIQQPCTTAQTPLPGSVDGRIETASKHFSGKPSAGQKGAAGRQGDLVSHIRFNTPQDKELVCECENVSMAEIRYAVDELGVHNLQDLRRRTRVGMGTCQGTLCIRKAAKALAEALGDPSLAPSLAADYLDERWKGMCPVGWGDTIREMEFMQRVYKTGKPCSYDEV
ncbi:MAG: anaerobic glycerol-3-phosphate dehydrogenase subunit A [Bacteroidales bacterium]|nr:anaerobic glycerol-3-phosphate dehydrogenase subunit A [Bacteroidales bacterium]